LFSSSIDFQRTLLAASGPRNVAPDAALEKVIVRSK